MSTHLADFGGDFLSLFNALNAHVHDVRGPHISAGPPPLNEPTFADLHPDMAVMYDSRLCVVDEIDHGVGWVHAVLWDLVHEQRLDLDSPDYATLASRRVRIVTPLQALAGAND